MFAGTKKKACFGVIILAASSLPGLAVSMDIQEATTCKLVKKEVVSASGPCEMVGFAGQGVYEVSIDAFGISVTLDENSDATMDGKPLAKYMRDARFGRTKDPKQRKYVCYVSGKGDLCVMAPR